jgi:hypothetical protein
VSSRTDIAYGRRGGGWADKFDGPALTGPPCQVCLEPMIVGQRQMHLICCAASGGRTPVCNPIKRKDRDGGGRVCAHCWKEA